MSTDENAGFIGKVGGSTGSLIPTIKIGDSAELRQGETGIEVMVIAVDGGIYRGEVIRCYDHKLDGREFEHDYPEGTEFRFTYKQVFRIGGKQ
jgi:hypothetical protein